MDKDIMKLLPQKAFKLLSIKDSLRIGALVTKSILDKKSYDYQLQQRQLTWKYSDIILNSKSLKTTANFLKNQQNGEKILKIYFSQFFENNLAIHLDLRSNSFNSDEAFHWTPSKLHYKFSPVFINGVRTLYNGFYHDAPKQFEEGLIFLGMIKDSTEEDQKIKIKDLFYKHFGEGKSAPVKFSLLNLQNSFNAIFSFFIKEDVPLNPEFAVLGINLVTLYLTLQEIPFELDVKKCFLAVSHSDLIEIL